MLIYHPIHDVNHCAYRLLLILESTTHSDLGLELFRLIDFYLIFPHLLKEIRPFPASLASFRKVINRIPEPYEVIGNVNRIIFDLEAIQTTAIQNLMAKNIIDIDFYRRKVLKRTEVPIPESIHKTILNGVMSFMVLATCSKN